jgi:hypothetical protein
MTTTTMTRDRAVAAGAFAHLVAAGEAVERGSLRVGDRFRTAGGTRWLVGTLDGGAVLVPVAGGRCFPLAYVLGDGRRAIIRTAALRGVRRR